jgi:hypothetical protein
MQPEPGTAAAGVAAAEPPFSPYANMREVLLYSLEILFLPP